MDDNGVLREITSTLIDHTEKKQTEMLQAKRTQEAIEMRDAQERFIDMTSHDESLASLGRKAGLIAF
jgi:hypothetical protein